MSGLKVVAGLITMLVPVLCWGHGTAGVPDDPDNPRLIEFPDVPGAKTLVVDLHSHSVFSDGHVWPKIRIEEAIRDGLDAFAVTEHLEWQPHLADIPHPDRNRAYEQAVAAAEGSDLIVIAGSEITREQPAGHINAVFITNANELFRPGESPEDPAATVDYYRAAHAWPAAEAVAAANAQGAFVFINHPDWPDQRPNGLAELTELHEQLIAEGQLHGVEIANGASFSAEAFAIALEADLTLLGVSDVHDLIDWDYPPEQGAHRPVTLVFSADASSAGIRQALFDKQTVVWFKNLLVGREAVLVPLLEASLTIESARYAADTDVLEVVFRNHSDAVFELENLTGISTIEHAGQISVPAHKDLTVSFKPGLRRNQLKLAFEVRNALIAPGRHPVLSFAVNAP